MYSRPSASKMWEPAPPAMNSGVPPTPFHARTGLLTPPGIFACARWKSRWERLSGIGGVHLALGMSCVKATGKRKKVFLIFFLAKKIKIDYVFFFEHRIFFLPARTDLMNKIIAASFWRNRGVFCAAAGLLSIFIWLALVTSHVTRHHRGMVELSTAVDNFVCNFSWVISCKFKALTGDRHG